jgi:hypothetical protein
MSPAPSKSKSKDKRAGKESNKASSKPSSNGNVTAGSGGSGGIPTSGYNPVLGMFHTIEASPVSSVPPLYVNGRFKNIDDSTDDHGGTGLDYDAVSNNDSLSGESEEHRDKSSHLNLRHDAAIPGADNDKREKNRQKNEKKHQRQKERRAQELHERCSGYLMSRKLESLAQQLVTMGFSSERATMALILNEGKVEESVNWLFEGGDESEEQKNNFDAGGGNLKIDISEELARIADMENKFKCSKMDIERVVVVCEGDLERAAESLKNQKPDPPNSNPKPEEIGDPPTSSFNSNTNIKTSSSVPVSHNLSVSSSSSLSRQQQQMKPSAYNYSKVGVVPVGSSVESSSKSMQPAKKIQIQQPQKSTEWVKPQNVVVPSDKRWPAAGSNPPSVDYSLTSSLQVPTSKIDNRFVNVGPELKNLQLGSVREPVIMMQRPQSANNKLVPTTTSMVQQQININMNNNMNNNSLEAAMKSNGLGPHIPPVPPQTNSHHLYNQFQYQQQQQQQQQYHFLDSAGTSSSGTRVLNSGWNRSGTSPPLAAASSLGLFSGLGSNGSSGSTSPVDWNAGGSMPHLDYANIDWSLDRGPPISRSSGMWHHNLDHHQHHQLQQHHQHQQHQHQHHQQGLNVNSFMMSDNHHQGLRSSSSTTMKRPNMADGGSHEWTSPFEEKDIFSLPRQFVSSPSL